MIPTVKENIELAPEFEAATWPWIERPYALIGLFDMLKFFAATFVTVTTELERAKGILGTEWVTGKIDHMNARANLEAALGQVQRQMATLPLSRAFQAQVQRLIARVAKADGRDEYEYNILVTLTSELGGNLQQELLEWLFFAVHPQQRPFYDAPERWYGQDIFAAYPDSENDLRAAARCFALGEHTACVFHLMRAVESALRKWAEQLGVILKMPATEANWQDIIDAGTASLKQLEQQPRSQRRTDDLEHFGETQAQFSSFKNAWRNHVAHGKQTYDEMRATEIMQAVRAFMRKLASRP